MSNVIVRDEDHYGKGLVINPNTGDFSRMSNGPWQGLGVAVSEICKDIYPELVAVYVDDGMLWLQLEGKRWPLDSLDLLRTSDQDGNCAFQVCQRGDMICEYRYAGPRADPINKADPAFDSLDEESQDLLFFITLKHKDEAWREGAIDSWSNPKERQS